MDFVVQSLAVRAAIPSFDFKLHLLDNDRLIEIFNEKELQASIGADFATFRNVIVGFSLSLATIDYRNYGLSSGFVAAELARIHGLNSKVVDFVQKNQMEYIGCSPQYILVAVLIILTLIWGRKTIKKLMNRNIKAEVKVCLFMISLVEVKMMRVNSLLKQFYQSLF